MSVEKIKNRIKNEVDEYLKSKEGVTLSNKEMVKEISKILQKYIDIPKIDIEAEIISDGKYLAVKYTTRGYMHDFI